MEDIDYSQIKIVGFVTPHINGRHAFINAVGYINESDWKFHPLFNEEAKSFFPPRGRVFAPCFQERYKHLIGKCIYAGLMSSKNDGPDNFIWNRENGKPDEYGAVIVNCDCKDSEIQDPNKLYHYLNQVGYLEKTDVIYLHLGNYLCVLEPDNIKKAYTVSVIDFDSALKNNYGTIVSYDQVHYVFVGRQIHGEMHVVDILPDTLLRNWLVNDFLMPEWGEIRNAQSTEKLGQTLIKLIAKSTLHKSVLRSRIRRCLSMLDRFVFTYNEVNNIVNLPGLKDIIDNSIKLHCEEYVLASKEKYQQEIENTKDMCNQRIEEEKDKAATQILDIQHSIDNSRIQLEIELEVLKQQKEQIENQISLGLLKVEDYEQKTRTLENKLIDLEKNKEQIIKNFTVVKNVLDLMKPRQDSALFKVPIELLDTESVCIDNPQLFNERLKFYLLQNNRKQEIALKIWGYLIHYKALLLPDNRIIHAILQATGRCYYTVQYVTPDWRSFSVVWTNGLEELVHSCLEHPDIMHYYVLQNINMSYLPCYLQPMADVSIGLLNKFPCTNIPYPENLRFLLTSTKEDGLPLALETIRYFGCLQNEDYVIDVDNENNFIQKENDIHGYLSLKDIKNMGFTPLIKSEYLSYISQNE